MKNNENQQQQLDLHLDRLVCFSWHATRGQTRYRIASTSLKPEPQKQCQNTLKHREKQDNQPQKVGKNGHTDLKRGSSAMRKRGEERG
jgi:hypothetical protein